MTHGIFIAGLTPANVLMGLMWILGLVILHYAGSPRRDK